MYPIGSYLIGTVSKTLRGASPERKFRVCEEKETCRLSMSEEELQQGR